MINVSLAGIGGQRTCCEDLGRSRPFKGLAGAYG